MGSIYFPQFKQGKGGIKLHPGLTILEAARIVGVKIHAECGGAGTCGRCVVRIDSGMENLNLPTKIEKQFNLKEKQRLACQARIIRDKSDVTVYIKNFGEYDILKYGTERTVALCPLYLNKDGVVFRGETAVEKYKGAIYGLAVDVGTTTVVFDLVDLENGDVLETVAKTNPQISYGNDVISRIEFVSADRRGGKYFEEAEAQKRLKELQGLLIELINGSLKELSEETGRDVSECIYHAVVVGNPTMRNILFGMDVASLGVMPYEPEDKQAVRISPAEIGLNINKKGEVYGAPLVGGHIGGDIVAGVLACEMYKSDGICLFIDIGTNGEIVMGNKEKMMAVSCAAGGAFEGTAVACGTGSIEGAIKKIELTDGRVAYSTIGSKYPIGVCGSGFIDLLAEFLRHGIMTQNARLKEDFYITGDIKITQNDIFQLITSKAAIKTGWQILLKNYPAELSQVEKIYMSGGFGNFIDINNAVKIGLIPEVEESRVVKIGNGALEGAREMLLCSEAQRLSSRLAEQIVHLRPGEAEKNFEYLLAENMYFY